MKLEDMINISLADIENMPDGIDKAECYIICAAFSQQNNEAHHTKWYVEQAYSALGNSLDELKKAIKDDLPLVNLTLDEIYKITDKKQKASKLLIGALLSIKDSSDIRTREFLDAIYQTQTYIASVFETLGQDFTLLQKICLEQYKETIRSPKVKLQGLDTLPKKLYERGIAP